MWHRGAIPIKIRAVARCHLKSPHAGTNRAASVVSLRGSRKETVLHVNGVAGCIRGRPKSQNNPDQTQRKRGCPYVRPQCFRLLDALPEKPREIGNQREQPGLEKDGMA